MSRDEQLGTMLRDLPVPETPPDFYDELLLMLEEEDAKQRGGSVVQLQPRRWRLPNVRRFPAFAAGAAAIVLLAAAIGVAVTLVNDGDRVPEVVETPTESGDGTLDFSAIAGTWEGRTDDGQASEVLTVTIEPGAASLGEVGRVEYRYSEGGDVTCTVRWLARSADPPTYEVIERTDDASACPNARVTLVHDPDTDTIAYDYVGQYRTTATLERVEAAAEVLDFSAIAGSWQGDLDRTSSAPLAVRLRTAWLEVAIEPEPELLGLAGTYLFRENADADVFCTGRWTALAADPPNYRIVERPDGSDLCPNGRVTLSHDQAADTLTYAFNGEEQGTLERVPGSPSSGRSDFLGSSEFAVPFVMSPDPDGEIRPTCCVLQGSEELFAVGDRRLIFLAGGPPSLDSWQSKFTGSDGVEVSGPNATAVGGAEGQYIEVRFVEAPETSEEGAGGRRGEYELYFLSEGVGQNSSDYAAPGETARIYVVEVDERLVSIVTVAPTDRWEQWIATIEEMLESIQWGVAP